MTFLQCFLLVTPFCVAYTIVMFWVIDKWAAQDRERGRARVEGRAVVRDEHQRPVMYLENYQMPCKPVGRERGVVNNAL